MTVHNRAALCIAAALASSACSTKPRTFSATVRPVVTLAASQGEGVAYATCNQLVRKGHKSNFTSAAATGGAAGAAVVGSAAAVAASGTVGIGATSAGYAMAAAIPFVGLAAGFGVNRLIRTGREKSYRKHMGACLAELGFEVVDWTRMKKKQPGTATLAAPAPAATVEAAPMPEVALTAD